MNMRDESSIPQSFFNEPHIEAIIAECERIAAIPVEDLNFSEPYLDIIRAIKIIRERNFPKDGTTVISNLEG